MKEQVSFYTKIQDKKIRYKIYQLNKSLLKQKEKVSYAYKNLITGDFITFNYDIGFYAASAIKFLVALYIYQEAEKDEKILNEMIHLTKEDIRPGSGVINKQTSNFDYTIRQLISLSLKESDNTAYIKLVEYVTKEKLIAFGKSLGAIHTLEGKDLFGIINASDMVFYLEALYKYFEQKTKLSQELKSFMLNPTYQIIEEKNIGNKEFVRKYGSFDIAYHEVGIVYDKEPYILAVLTQKDKLKEKEKKKYINKVAKRIYKIHNLLYNNKKEVEK